MNIGITDSSRAEVNDILSTLLADEYLLYTKTRNAHWNVTGPDFHAMHAFFESQHIKIDDAIDEIAERIRSIDHVPPGSLAELIRLARLTEIPGKIQPGGKFIEALLIDHEAMIRQLRGDAARMANLGDEGSSDFLIGLMRDHEKMAWMLRSSLC
jgi:starvation-inducible DNA-binding protein